MGENAYKIELAGDMQISATFTIEDLTPYLEDDERHIEDLRENPLHWERLMRSKLQAWT